jgi:hypothetical protein
VRDGRPAVCEVDTPVSTSSTPAWTAICPLTGTLTGCGEAPPVVRDNLKRSQRLRQLPYAGKVRRAARATTAPSRGRLIGDRASPGLGECAETDQHDACVRRGAAGLPATVPGPPRPAPADSRQSRPRCGHRPPGSTAPALAMTAGPGPHRHQGRRSPAPAHPPAPAAARPANGSTIRSAYRRRATSPAPPPIRDPATARRRPRTPAAPPPPRRAAASARRARPGTGPPAARRPARTCSAARPVADQAAAPGDRRTAAGTGAGRRSSAGFRLRPGQHGGLHATRPRGGDRFVQQLGFPGAASPRSTTALLRPSAALASRPPSASRSADRPTRTTSTLFTPGAWGTASEQTPDGATLLGDIGPTTAGPSPLSAPPAAVRGAKLGHDHDGHR